MISLTAMGVRRLDGPSGSPGSWIVPNSPPETAP